MAYGFQAFNTKVNSDGDPAPEVIISDTYSCLHFIGKADIGSNDGGQFEQQVTSGSSDLSDRFPDFTGGNAANALDGRVLINYTIITSGRPMAFIKPTANAYDRWYSIITQSEDPLTNEWTFQVLMSGIAVDNFPELFIFVQADSVPTSILASETHGMIVRNANGEKTFDSRAQPLSIIAAESQQPRDFAPNEGTPVNKEQFSNYIIDSSCTYNTLDHDFHCNSGTFTDSFGNVTQIIGRCNNPPIALGMTEDNCLNEQGGTNWAEQGSNSGFGKKTLTDADMTPHTDTPLTDLMFSVPASYQAVFTRQAHSTDSFTDETCFGTAAWWVMYRGANRLQPHATTTDAVSWHTGWGTFAAGYNFEFRDEDVDWNGRPTATDPGDWTTGFMPYDSAANINSETTSLMVVADSTKYT